MMKEGSAARALAMPIRCFCPPESSGGKRLLELRRFELDEVEELVDPVLQLRSLQSRCRTRPVGR